MTLERIRKIPRPDGKQAIYIFDDDPSVLAVRVTPAGSKAFVFCGKLNQTPFRVTIGDVGVWSLEDARNEARRLQTLVDQGIDPRIQKAEVLAVTQAKQAEARRVEAPALGAWQEYCEARSHIWGARMQQDHQRYVDAGGKPKTRGRRPGEGDVTQPGLLYHLLNENSLRELTAERVSSWLQAHVLERPTMASLAYRFLRAFLRWCESHPTYGKDIHSGVYAVRSVKDHVPRVRAKDDCLQREQLPLWFEHVRHISNPVISAYLQSLLLTGARREELAGLKWVNVDFQWKSITIADKVEDFRVIPLCPYIEWLLVSLPCRNEFVFSSLSSESGHITEPRIQHNKALQAAGLPSLTLHGLRRSFGTLCEWVEVPAGISAQIMGHKPSALAEKHYRKRPLDLLRSWHTKIEAWMLEQAGLQQPEAGSQRLRVVG